MRLHAANCGTMRCMRCVLRCTGGDAVSAYSSLWRLSLLKPRFRFDLGCLSNERRSLAFASSRVQPPITLCNRNPSLETMSSTQGNQQTSSQSWEEQLKTADAKIEAFRTLLKREDRFKCWSDLQKSNYQEYLTDIEGAILKSHLKAWISSRVAAWGEVLQDVINWLMKCFRLIATDQVTFSRFHVVNNDNGCVALQEPILAMQKGFEEYLAVLKELADRAYHARGTLLYRSEAYGKICATMGFSREQAAALPPPEECLDNNARPSGLTPGASTAPLQRSVQQGRGGPGSRRRRGTHQ